MSDDASGLDTQSRAWWRELEHDAESRYPRLVARFGRCPACRRGATAAMGWGEITWAICDGCKVRWPAGRNLLPGERNRQLLRLYLAALAELTQF